MATIRSFKQMLAYCQFENDMRQISAILSRPPSVNRTSMNTGRQQLNQYTASWCVLVKTFRPMGRTYHLNRASLVHACSASSHYT